MVHAYKKKWQGSYFSQQAVLHEVLLQKLFNCHGTCSDLDKMKASQKCRTSVIKANRRNLSSDSKQFVKMDSNLKYVNLSTEELS